jgi:hypothetical protein
MDRVAKRKVFPVIERQDGEDGITTGFNRRRRWSTVDDGKWTNSTPVSVLPTPGRLILVRKLSRLARRTIDAVP